MKISVDGTKCQGMGVCAQISPESFDIDDWGFATASNDGEVPAEREDEVRRAIAGCPEKAVVEN